VTEIWRPTLEDLSDPAPEPGPADWNDDGVVRVHGLLDEGLMAAYEAAWDRENGGPRVNLTALGALVAERPGGWPDCAPYLRVPELLALATSGPLAAVLEELIGEPAALNLCLTGWTSTRRQWHQDGYLNKDSVGDRYAAVWMSLGRIYSWMGPFTYVPGSHRWHRLKMAKVLDALGEDGSRPDWPWRSEALLTPLVEERIDADEDSEVETFCPGRGDVLVWHPRLYHRGSEPAFPNAYRPALICHYSGVSTRPDFPDPVRAEGGGWYFPLEEGP
jgi:hypothetical protein